MDSPIVYDSSPSATSTSWEPRTEKQCSICSKCFDRRDTMMRHVRIHYKQRRPPESRKKSCVACIRSKIKCSLEKPFCSSCSKRRIRCVYEIQTSSTPHETEVSSPQYGERLTEIPSTPSRTTNGNGSIPSHHDFIPTPASSMDFPAQLEHIDTFDNFTDIAIDWNVDWIFDNRSDDVLLLGQRVSNAPEGFQVQAGAAAEYTPQLLYEGSATDQASRTPESRTSRPQVHAAPPNPWPIQWNAAPFRITALPSLGSPEQGHGNISRHFSIPPIDSSTLGNLQDNIRLHLGSSPWLAVSLSAFPSKEKLDHCIDLYFKHFDWILPVVHRPSFDPAKEPVVTLGIICIGACYTELKDAHKFSNILSELLRRVLVFMSEADPPFVRTETYITAQLLQISHGYGSGSKRLLDLAESCRNSMVHNARRMGLFRHRQSTAMSNMSVKERWHAWIKDERIRRLGWAIYGSDSAVGYLFNSRSFISVAEISMDLQSSTEHWEAPTEHSWAALHPWTNSVPENIRFVPLIRSLFDGTEGGFAKMTEDHHRLPIILTLLRMLWGTKEVDSSPLSDLLHDRYQKRRSRENILDVLDHFVNSPTESPATYMQESRMHVLHMLQTVNMAHLIGASNMMDWLYSILRGGLDAEQARVRMESCADQDPKGVRKITYCCAQILSMIRQYPYNLPTEAFNAFHAGTMLWCLAGLLAQQCNPDHSIESDKQQTVLYLDYLGAANDPKTLENQAWIQHGGPYMISVYGVPNLCCKLGQQQTLEQTANLLKRMQVWGIAQNFSEVVLGLLRRRG